MHTGSVSRASKLSILTHRTWLSKAGTDPRVALQAARWPGQGTPCCFVVAEQRSLHFRWNAAATRPSRTAGPVCSLALTLEVQSVEMLLKNSFTISYCKQSYHCIMAISLRNVVPNLSMARHHNGDGLTPATFPTSARLRCQCVNRPANHPVSERLTVDTLVTPV